MKPEVKQKLNERLQRYLTKLPDFLIDYIYYLEYQKKELRTKIEYAKDIVNFLEFLEKRKDAINKEIFKSLEIKDIWEYLNYITYYEKEFVTPSGKKTIQIFTNSEKGKARKIACLYNLFEYLQENGYVEKNIIKKVSIKTNQGNIKERLTKEEIKKLLKVISNQRDYVIILFFLYTGIRISELIGLDIDNVNIEERYITVTRKGGKIEKVYIPNKIIKEVKEYLDKRKAEKYPTKALFVSSQKKRINPRTINEMIKKYTKQAMISKNITPHMFRRTFGTYHYNLYNDMFLTAQVLGHKSAETTRKFYADPLESRVMQSMENFNI